MPKQPKKRKPGRPRLPKGQAKGKIVPVRFGAEELERIYQAAKSSDKTVSEWIRSTLNAAMGLRYMKTQIRTLPDARKSGD